MTTTTRIGWCHHTLNFWWGCTKVSPECDGCYIGPIMRRGGHEPFDGPVRLKGAWSEARRINARCEKEGVRERVFTCSMSDFFHRKADPWRAEAWRLIRECRAIDWLILTKRIGRWRHLGCPPGWMDEGNGYPNVWLGVTAGHKKSINRVARLAEIPARVRFVSAEPLLQPMHDELRPWMPYLDWVIAGGESGRKASERRWSEVEWFDSLNALCQVTETAYFMKQGTDHRDGQQSQIPDRLWDIKQVPIPDGGDR